MGFNQCLRFVTFQYIGFNHLELYCILTIVAWLNLTSILIADIWNYEPHVYLFIFFVLNVRTTIESKYPSIVFLINQMQHW